jgi:hypothetical protein
LPVQSQSKKLLHNKRNGHQIEGAAHRMGEISASYVSDLGSTDLRTVVKIE